MRSVYFSLGSNMGDRAGYLRAGVQNMTQSEPFRLSNVYETAPVGGVAQDDFWNLVLEVTTDLTADSLLRRLRAAEMAARRERTLRWGPRTLDVDVVWWDDMPSDNPELTVPHPRLYERRFVLAPLRELRPDLVTDEQWVQAQGEVRNLGTLDVLQ